MPDSRLNSLFTLCHFNVLIKFIWPSNVFLLQHHILARFYLFWKIDSLSSKNLKASHSQQVLHLNSLSIPNGRTRDWIWLTFLQSWGSYRNVIVSKLHSSWCYLNTSPCIKLKAPRKQFFIWQTCFVVLLCARLWCREPTTVHSCTSILGAKAVPVPRNKQDTFSVSMMQRSCLWSRSLQSGDKEGSTCKWGMWLKK